MSTLNKIGTKLTEILDDITEAAFAALAWIEEGDNFQKLAVGGSRGGSRRMAKSRVPARASVKPQSAQVASAHRWMM
jgi:hypothetical protein